MVQAIGDNGAVAFDSEFVIPPADEEELPGIAGHRLEAGWEIRAVDRRKLQHAVDHVASNSLSGRCEIARLPKCVCWLGGVLHANADEDSIFVIVQHHAVIHFVGAHRWALGQVEVERVYSAVVKNPHGLMVPLGLHGIFISPSYPSTP